MGGGIKLRQGERDLNRKQGERWGKWKVLSPPKDWRRSSRGWREAFLLLVYHSKEDKG